MHIKWIYTFIIAQNQRFGNGWRRLLVMNEDEYYENLADQYEDPKPTQEELEEAKYAAYEDQYEDEMDLGDGFDEWRLWQHTNSNCELS